MGWLFAGVFLLVALGNLGIAFRWYAAGKVGRSFPSSEGSPALELASRSRFKLCGTGGGYR
jgi:hypothetical protein